MSLMTGLFNLLALLYIGRAVQLAVQVARNWNVVRQEPLTGEKQRLAEQAAFFLGVPPAVFVHELAHAVAVLAFGGQVAEFGYRVFWGYVVPQGSFTALQNWIIALVGTLGSLGFGALLWLVRPFSEDEPAARAPATRKRRVPARSPGRRRVPSRTKAKASG